MRSRRNGKSRTSCARRWARSIPSLRAAIFRPSARCPLAIAAFVSALIGLVVPYASHAQTPTETPPGPLDVATICSKPSVPRTINPVRDILTEYRDLTYDFCRVKEDYKEGGFTGMWERELGTGQHEFVDVFEGPGQHREVGASV